MVCDIVDWMEQMHYIDDALGMCAGVSSFHLKPPYHIHNFPKFISTGAGVDMDEAKLTKAAKRYRTEPTTSGAACEEKMRGRPIPTGKKDFPNLKPICWIRITKSRGGIRMVFRR
jgi:benzoyl-CoA reductase subunit BamB